MVVVAADFFLLAVFGVTLLADPTAAGSDELTRACLDVAGHHLLPGASLVLRVGPGRLEAVRREAAWNDLRVTDARHFGDQGSLVRLDVPPGS